MLLLERRETLTPADHQTHRKFSFNVPNACRRLTFSIRYQPKFLSASDSAVLVNSAVVAKRTELTARVGATLAEDWAAVFENVELIVPNLLTLSLDDADGRYRGAGHRHHPDQQLFLSSEAASPGLLPGDLPTGEWVLTLTAHTVVSSQCELEIQIGAEIAASPPSASTSLA